MVAGGEGPLPNLNELAKEHVDQLFDVKNLTRLERVLTNAIQSAVSNAIGGIITAAGGIGVVAAKLLEGGEAVVAPILAPFLSQMIQSAFGIEVSAATLARMNDAAARKEVGRAIGITVLGALENAPGELQPGKEPAEKLIGMLGHLAIDSWAEATFAQWLLALFGVLHELEALSKLAPAVVQSTGLDELGRIGLRPLANVTVATPLTWHANKTYRPTLLSAALACQQFIRGVWTREQTNEELARLGYSPDRIDALLSAQFKRLSLDDVLLLMRGGTLDRAYALQNLRDEGFDNETAQFAVTAAEIRRAASIEDNSLAAITRAYVDRDLTESQFRTLFPPNIYTDDERDAYVAGASIQRGVNVKHLTHGEVIECIELAILPRAFYREWLQREGYPDDEAFALELRLAAKLDKQLVIEAERRRLADERAREKQDRLDAARLRKEEVDAERALHRRGSLADLNRAVVRGLIPISRLEEVLRPQYDADTVQTLVNLVEDDRQTFLEQQKRAEEARQRAGIRHVDTGALEQAVLEDVLTLQDFRGQLEMLGFSPGDVDVLTRTLQARKADLDTARDHRLQAEEAARHKGIDLGRAERLVRHGASTLAQYDQLLASLGFDAGARAAMTELLKLEIADDAEARRLRDAAAEKGRIKGLSLEQMRRAVILDVKTEDEFQTYLIAEGYTSDAQLVLLAELRRDVADAEAARAQRAAAEAKGSAMPLPLARVHQAARLGLITPATYRARLVQEKFTPDDIALELELLLVEIADVQAARARRDALSAQLDAPKALSLAQLEHAVKAGAASIDDYRAAASAVYGADDVDVLVATLQGELATLADARDRHVTIEGELTARTLSLGELEAAVKAGLVTLDAYRAQLIAWGYGADDADLLAALLAEHLTAAGGTAQ